MTYPEAFSRLGFETGVILFIKKDGSIRVMLGTRNLKTVEILYGFQGPKLGGHDNRCNISNGNVAVFDMIAGDARSFNINRLAHIEWLGVISSKEQLDNAIELYKKVKDDYSRAITLDDI